MNTSEDITNIVMKAMGDAVSERGHVNVLIAGRTGVGKSTLINAVFQGNLAETGQGKPVTTTTREISKEGIPLTIFDTRGLELQDYQNTLQELENLVKERLKETDASKHIHVAWLCIHEDGRRVEPAEIALHHLLAQHMPVIGVITKARADNNFRMEVQRLLPEAKNVVRVRALQETLDEGHVLPLLGLENLVDVTAQAIPEAYRRAFIAAQKASLQKKKELAHKIVIGASAAAAAAGASPIPFSDALILVPIQIGMLASISSAFGLELSTAFLSTLVASMAGTTGATFLGRAIVTNLLKFIPGVGTVTGGAISAATAAGLTTTLGEIYISTLESLASANKGEPPSTDQVVQEFNSRVKKKA